MNLAGRFIGAEKTQKLSQAFDFANQITSVTRNPEEVMQKAGITLENVRTARTLLANPFGEMIVKCLGGDKQTILSGLSKAEQMLGGAALKQISFAEQAPASELDELQATLARLKAKAKNKRILLWIKKVTVGAHWKYEDVEEVARKRNIDPDEIPEFYFVLNMMYSDYAKQSRTVDDYVELAMDFIDDKAERYFRAMRY